MQRVRAWCDKYINPLSLRARTALLHYPAVRIYYTTKYIHLQLNVGNLYMLSDQHGSCARSETLYPALQRTNRFAHTIVVHEAYTIYD